MAATKIPCGAGHAGDLSCEWCEPPPRAELNGEAADSSPTVPMLAALCTWCGEELEREPSTGRLLGCDCDVESRDTNPDGEDGAE